MGLLKKIFTVLLVCSFLFIQFPNTGLAGLYAKANASTKITENAPQIFSTPEKDIPTTEGHTWLYVLLGLLVVGGIAAAMGGGGDSGGSTPPPATGNISVGW